MMVPYRIIERYSVDGELCFHITRDGLEDPNAQLLMFEIDLERGGHIKDNAFVIVDDRVYELLHWTLGDYDSDHQYSLRVMVRSEYRHIDHLGVLGLKRLGL
jgi:hypothetical protein